MSCHFYNHHFTTASNALLCPGDGFYITEKKWGLPLLRRRRLDIYILEAAVGQRVHDILHVLYILLQLTKILVIILYPHLHLELYVK